MKLIASLFTSGAIYAVMAAPALADDQKFVGVWEGSYETPIYTKLVLKPDKSLTYCEVSHCRQVNCMDMKYSGSLESRFEYTDSLGTWEFVRLSEDEFEATYTHVEGDVSIAYYEPE